MLKIEAFPMDESEAAEFNLGRIVDELHKFGIVKVIFEYKSIPSLSGARQPSVNISSIVFFDGKEIPFRTIVDPVRGHRMKTYAFSFEIGGYRLLASYLSVELLSAGRLNLTNLFFVQKRSTFYKKTEDHVIWGSFFLDVKECKFIFTKKNSRLIR